MLAGHQIPRMCLPSLSGLGRWAIRTLVARWMTSASSLHTLCSQPSYNLFFCKQHGSGYCSSLRLCVDNASSLHCPRGWKLFCRMGPEVVICAVQTLCSPNYTTVSDSAVANRMSGHWLCGNLLLKSGKSESKSEHCLNKQYWGIDTVMNDMDAKLMTPIGFICQFGQCQ